MANAQLFLSKPRLAKLALPGQKNLTASRELGSRDDQGVVAKAANGLCGPLVITMPGHQNAHVPREPLLQLVLHSQDYKLGTPEGPFKNCLGVLFYTDYIQICICYTS